MIKKTLIFIIAVLIVAFAGFIMTQVLDYINKAVSRSQTHTKATK